MQRLAVLFLCACSFLHAQEPLTLEKIAADSKLWPVEVMVIVDHKVPLVVDGKVARTIKIGPGKTYRVKTISPTGVSIQSLESLLTFKADETDVIARAEQVKARQEALAAAPPPTPEPAPPPEPQPATVAAAAPAPADPPAANTIAAKLAGQLVRFNGDKLEPFDAAQLGGKKFLAIYFSASWCGPCRRFTPALVEWYKTREADHAKFDVIFVSRDQNEGAMVSYMAEDEMEWPAVSFSKAQGSLLGRYAGNGIPCLVIISENGSVLANSYEGGTYVGPMKPLRYLDNLLNAL